MGEASFRSFLHRSTVRTTVFLALLALVLMGLPTGSVSHGAAVVAPRLSSTSVPTPAAARPANVISYRSGTPFSGGGYGVAFDAFHQTFDVASTTGLQVVKEGTWTSGGSVSLSLGSYCRVVVDSGRQLAFVSGGNAGDISIINTTTLAVVSTLVTSGGAQGMALDTSRHLLVYTDSASLDFYDYASSTRLASVTLPGPTRVAIDPAHQVVGASSPGANVMWFYNETTHQWIGNTPVVSSTLPVTFVPDAGVFVAGSNANDGFTVLSDTSVGRSTNGTIPLMSSLQDMTPVGGGTDEVLVWGLSELAVVATNNLSVMQNVVPMGGSSFPYGIAVDPSTEVALGVDPSAQLDTPFLPGLSSVPSAPTNVALTPGNGTVAATWGASIAYRVTNYSLQFGPSAGALTYRMSIGSGTLTTAHVPWPDGSRVFLTVTAWNGSVSSSPSAPVVSVVPDGVPYPPQNVTGAAQGSSSIQVQWDPPARNDGSTLLLYRVGVHPASGTGWTYQTVPASSTSAVVSGLSAGAAYELNVSAINSVGDGNSSLPITVTLPPNAQPTLLQSLTSFPGVLLFVAAAAGAILVILLLWRRSRRRGGLTAGAPPSGLQSTPQGGAQATYPPYPQGYPPAPYGTPPPPPYP